MGADALESPKMSRENLMQLIAQWNANRLDLFEISEPNEEGEFHGVMRFYFQEAGAKVATKCIRVASSATAKAVIETLVEKFRPDMRMLSIPQYALYEIHENGEERRLEDPERPLLVQLNWHSDDREGRFLLRRIDDKMSKVPEIPMSELSFKRKLSKREKKQLKKLQEKTKSDAERQSVAEKLYTELPETSFTRSISNPEAVMRRRRQQKLEKKLAQFRSRDGGPDTGGTLKIYGESLCRDVPYKTLLLSVNDTAAYVVKEMLAKYSLTNYDPLQYCLVQVCEGEGEYILEDDESPLSILMNQPSSRGSIMFHVRRRPPDFHPRKRKKKPTRRADEERGSGYRGSYDGQIEPLLIELLPDGSETGRRIALETEVTEVGSDWDGLQLPGLRPRHCVLANTEGIVTVTPCSRDADIYVNGQRIYETSLLQHGTIIRFGRTHYFRFAQRGRPFSEREIAEPSQTMATAAAAANNPSSTLTGGNNNASQSPPLSPSNEEIPRIIRADSILPATLELPEAGEEGFLAGIIVSVTPTTLQFKLAPTYALYLAARYRATTHFRPEATPHERAHLLSAFLLRVASIMMQTIGERNSDGNYLAFWMANASELLHFLKSDRQIGAFSLDAQDVLAEVVQLSFRHLVTCIQAELSNLVPIFLLERDEEDEKATTPILGVLGSGMTLLRRCRVNAALTIQLFSQLFHFINMAVFNKIIGMDGGRNYCSRLWGTRLRRRLNRIETWAEKQGLELAADCHLVRVVQAAHLLQSPKNTPEELATIASSCFKLNSQQLRCLLMKYQYEADEVPVPSDILDNVIRVAESTVDEVIRTDGRHVRVEEEPLLGLAFLLPEDGYSCDIVRGVPAGLIEFLTPLAPLCRLTPNPSAAGYWTIFFHDPMRSPSAMSGRSFATQGFSNNLQQTSSQQTTQQQQQQLSNNYPNSSGMVSSLSNNQILNPPSASSALNNSSMMGNHSSTSGNLSSVPGGPGPTTNSAPGNHHLINNNLQSPSAGQSSGGFNPNSALNNSASIVANNSNGLLPGSPNRGSSNLAGEPEIQTIKLQKLNSGLGLSIVAAKGVGQDRLGIYIKSVVNGGSADMDGRLGPGDQLLSVDGQSLVGITQEKAAEYLVRTGPVVTLEVAKQAAIYQGLATMLSQPSPVMSRAGGPSSHQRRMSERDLPSKVLREQNQEMESHHHHHHSSSHHSILQPRIHSSKSVPSLNSESRDHHPIPMSSSIGPGMVSPSSGGGMGAPLNVSHLQGNQGNVIMRSPGGGGGGGGGGGSGPFHSHLHGQHSSSASSSHHDPNMRPYTQGGYPLNSMTMQPHSNKSHLMGPPSSMDLRSRSIQSLADPPTSSSSSSANHIGMKQPSTPSLHLQGGGGGGGSGEDERYYQNVGFYPPPPPPPNNPNPANMPLRTYIPYSSSSGNIPQNPPPPSHLTNSSSMPQFRPAPGGGSYRGPPPNLNTNSVGNLNWQRQQQQQLQQQQQQQQQQQMALSQQQIGMNQQQIGLHRDLMRQEAKMLEMQDELRRREERAALMMTKAQQQQNRYAPRFTYTPTPPGQQQMSAHLAQRVLGPPSVPSKPSYRPDSLHGAPDGPPGPGRPPLPEEFKFSSGDPPRGAFAYNGLLAKPLGGNPWEQAEKEREALRRKEMARFWREQQIQELESLSSRNPSQEEQLRALRLEREFQRRAEEVRREDDGEGDEDEEEEDERKAMVRRVQEDLERTRISSGSSLHPMSHANGNKLDQSMEEERARKIEEMRRKKLELEAAQAAEERLVREATRRREEELRRQQSQMIQHQQQQQQQHQLHLQQQQQQQQHQQQQQQQSLQQGYHQNYRSSYPTGRPAPPDNLNLTSPGMLSPTGSSAPPLPTSPPPSTTVFRSAPSNNNVNSTTGGGGGGSAHPPVATPEKLSPVTPPQSSPRQKGEKKSVSFMETVATNEVSSPGESPPTERVREDPNRFLNEATALLASPRSPDGTSPGGALNTPGVIGAQEVYRDPRWRRLQEQQQKQQANAPKPEKLTFKEKMKMFAMESGEDQTPKEKVKSSKAQREIETPGTPVSTESNN